MKLTPLAILCMVFMLFSQTLNAQLPNGSTAPAFTLDDLGGASHDLYTYLNQGKGAIIDVSATWCGPCWNYHQQGVLEDLWNDFGPYGEDDIMVFMVEADGATTQPCIYGPTNCTGGTAGDWTIGVDYPILNPPSAQATQFNNDYAINYFPTLYFVLPNGEINEVGQASYSEWAGWAASAGMEALTPTIVGDYCDYYKDISLNIEKGFGNLSYYWSNGASTSALYQVPPGNYSCTVTDQHGWSIVAGPYSLTGVDGVETEILQSNITCNGDQDGYLESTQYGGSGNFQYDWSNGEATQSIYNLPEGNYQLTVTDMNTGCTNYVEYYISEPTALAASYNTIPADCDGNNGQVIVSPSGGVSPYQFVVDGDTYFFFQDIILPAGDHDVTVRDYNGCTHVASVNIPSSDIPEAFAENTGQLNCYNDMVGIHADTSSMGSNIVYSWFDTSGTVIDTGYMLMMDSTGVFGLEVYDAVSTCVDTAYVEVTQNFTAPTAMVAAMGQIDCTSSMVDVSGSGSSADTNMVYQWTTTNGNIIGDDTQLDIVVDMGGDYSLMVTDTLNGCSSTEMVNVASFLNVPAINVLAQSSIDCNNSLATITIEDNTDYEYSWSSDNGSIASGANSSEVEVSSAGDYTVTALDPISGCSTTETVSIVQSVDLPEVDIDPVSILDCNQTSTMISASNNTDYDYSWSTSDGNIVGASNDTDINVNAPGSYQLEITDPSNGCVNVYTVEVDENITTPSVVLESLGALDCNTTSTRIELDSNNSLDYQWNTNDGNIQGNARRSFINVNAPGEYSVVVTDPANGCTSTESFTVEEDVTAPSFNLTGIGVIDCDNPEARLKVTGNFGDTYEWTFDGQSVSSGTGNHNLMVDQAGTYTIVVTDKDNGCTTTESIDVESSFEVPTITLLSIQEFDCTTTSTDIELENNTGYSYAWSTSDGVIISGMQMSTLSVGAAGTYEVEVTNDSNGCTETASYEVTSNTTAPTVSLSGQEYFCLGGSTTICVDSDSNDLAWDVNGSSAAATQNCIEVSQNATITVEATNDSGCKSSTSITVSEVQLPEILLNTPEELDCVIPEVNLTAEIMIDPINYTFVWYDAQNNQLGAGDQLTVSDAGMYTVVMTDNDTGCSTSASLEVTQDNTATPVSAYDFAANEFDFTFTQQSTGTVDQYYWDFGDGNISQEENPQHSYTTPGIYNVCLTSSNKCGVDVICMEVIAESPVGVSVDQTDITCYGMQDGSLSAAVSGGITPTISWTGPAGFTSDQALIDGLAPGVYDLKVTSSSNEEQTNSFEILEPAELLITADIIDSDGADRGSITLTIAGGVGAYEILWSDGSTEITLEDLVPGFYDVEVIDENGCAQTATFEVQGTVNVNEINALQSFEISPNPAYDMMSIQLTLNDVSNLSMEVYTSLGQLVYENQYQTNSINEKIEVSAWDNGIYFVKIRKDDKVAVQKVMISN